ncbi:hypothetical protein Gasu2_60460 [Galdieria sulphuraria]|nr:hypothetical protein Gasu2_60460 [Galdieria sulphuraria]
MLPRTKAISLFAPLSSEIRLYSSCFKSKSKRSRTCIQDTCKNICVKCYSVRAQMTNSNVDGEEIWPGLNRRPQQSLESYIAGTLFPLSLEEAVQQASSAVVKAAEDNYKRLRVELQYPTLSTVGSLLEYGELAYFCNMIHTIF